MSYAAQKNWMCRRLRGWFKGKQDKAFIDQCFDEQISIRELHALYGATLIQLQQSRGEVAVLEGVPVVVGMEDQHFFGAMTKLLDVGRKLVELSLMQQIADAPDHIVIEVRPTADGYVPTDEQGDLLDVH